MVRYWLNRVRFGQTSLAVTVFTTRRCNLECTYCYERHEHVGAPEGDMSLDTAERVARWIGRYVTSRGLRKVHLTFYGGEPLCNVPCILLICDSVAAVCKDLGISYQTYLITNGVLASAGIIGDLKRHNLTQVQVTLDGPPSVHDLRRRHRSGTGSFNETLRGLKNVSSVCSAVVRCNVDQDTIDSVDSLLGILANEGLANRKNLFAVANTYDCESGCGMVGHRSWVENSAKIMRKAKALGFGLRNPFKVSPCFGVREGSFAFDVDGAVYTCSQMAGIRSAQVGDVSIDRLAETYYDLLLTNPLSPECYVCSYLPICLGGCRANVVRRGLELGTRLCRKDEFGDLVPPLLKVLFE